MRRILSAAFWMSVIVTSVAAAPGVVTISCTANVNPAARVLITPGSIAFGNVDTLSVSTAPLSVKNVGGGTLRGAIRKAPACVPGWSILVNDAPVDSVPFALTANQERIVTVRFIANGLGPRNCGVEVVTR